MSKPEKVQPKTQLTDVEKSINTLGEALNLAAKSGAFDLQQSVQVTNAMNVVFKAALGN